MTKKKLLKGILLEVIQRLGGASLSIIDEGFLNSRYAFTHPSRELLGLSLYENHKKKIKKSRKAFFSILLFYLKKDGLVVKTGARKNAIWRISPQGKKYLQQLADDNNGNVLPRQDGRLRLVIFDIPEKERQKRDRLRELLISSGFEILQKSVWLGKRPLSEEMVRKMKDYNLKNYVHIFEVTKKGTL